MEAVGDAAGPRERVQVPCRKMTLPGGGGTGPSGTLPAMDLASRMDAMLLELRAAEARLAGAERLLVEGRANIGAREARLGGAHELAQAQHEVEEARRMVDEASTALAHERAALSSPAAH